MSRTFGWIVVILTVTGWYAWGQWSDFWNRRHELLAAEIIDRFSEIAPEWQLEFASVELRSDASVQLKELRVSHREAKDWLLFAPDVIVNLDRDLLAGNLQVLATRVELHDPVVRLVRDPNGDWNWRDWPVLTGQTAPAPEIDCRGGVIQIRVAEGRHLPEAQFDLTDVQFKATNQSFHQYELRGQTMADAAGQLEFEGALNVDTLAWSMGGRCASLNSPNSLMQMAASLSGEARQRIESLASEYRTDQETTGNRVPVRSVNHATSAPGNTPLCTWPALGIAANLELAFRLEQRDLSQPLQYMVGARIQDGVIDNSALPIPLHDLRGELFVDNNHVVIKSFQASNGNSRIIVDGQLRTDGQVPAKRFVVQAHNLQFGREIETHLWGNLRKIYDELRPAGRFNIDLAAETTADDRWRVTLNQFEAADCSILPADFPYPAHSIQGRITQQGESFQIDFSGLMGDRPLTVQGELINPGPDAICDLAMEVEGVRIDETLLRAFGTAELLDVQEALVNLQLTGFASAKVRLSKRGMADAKPQIAVDAVLHQGTIRFDDFRYLLTDVSGRVVHDPYLNEPGEPDVWRFLDLKGRHGSATVTGQGSLLTNPGMGFLDLSLDAGQVPIDRHLEAACISATPRMQDLFDSIGRSGTVDLKNIRIQSQLPGKPAIQLPSIVVKDGELRLKSLPYPWERVNAQLSWREERLTIDRLTGWSGTETYLEIRNGGDPDAATLTFMPQGEVEWQLHLEDIRVRKLVADGVLRRSLSQTSFGPVVEALDPLGPIDFDLGLDIKGYRQDPDMVTATWHLDAQMANHTITPGVELSNVTGRLKIVRGVWDGYRSFIDGMFELESARVFGIALTSISGPFLVNGDDVFIGTPAWPEVRIPPPYDPVINTLAGREIQADIYGGKVGFNAQARLSSRSPEETTYRLALSVRDARLEEWAGENGITGERLRGPINGQLDLVGQGTSDRTPRGQGWVQISPAQLYELPVLNRVLSSFDLRQPDRTAFTYAYGEFTIHDGLFNFSLIDLVGDSLRLVGRGNVAYAAGLDGRLAIDFYRSKFRNQIPVFGQIFSTVTTNSIGVRVNGTMENPIVNVQPKLGIVDDALRKLLDSFNAGQMPVAPRGVPGAPAPSPMPAQQRPR